MGLRGAGYQRRKEYREPLTQAPIAGLKDTLRCITAHNRGPRLAAERLPGRRRVVLWESGSKSRVKRRAVDDDEFADFIAPGTCEELSSRQGVPSVVRSFCTISTCGVMPLDSCSAVLLS